MPFIEQLGQQAAGSILGIGLGAWNDARQVNQQKEMNEMNKGMMDYSMQKQYEMWQKTGYVGQMEQMKKAGINPALMYGMGGGGGQSLGAPGGGGATATGHSGEATGMGIAAANIGLMDAQRRNLDADTKDKLANIPGKGKEPALKEAQTADLTASANLKKIEEEYLRDTKDDRVHQQELYRQLAQEQLQIIENEAGISEATKGERIKQAYQQTLANGLAMQLVKANTKATGQSIEESKQRVEQIKAQITKFAAEIAQGQQNLDRQEQELIIKAFEAELKGQFPGLGSVLGGIINGGMEEWREIIGDKGRDRTYPLKIKTKQ